MTWINCSCSSIVKHVNRTTVFLTICAIHRQGHRHPQGKKQLYTSFVCYSSDVRVKKTPSRYIRKTVFFSSNNDLYYGNFHTYSNWRFSIVWINIKRRQQSWKIQMRTFVLKKHFLIWRKFYFFSSSLLYVYFFFYFTMISFYLFEKMTVFFSSILFLNDPSIDSWYFKLYY